MQRRLVALVLALSAPAAADDEVRVRAAARAQDGASATEVGAEQGRQLPGARGDPLQVVSNLPGVARAPLGSGALVLWGAAPGDTRVYVDDVPVPRMFHDGGYRSILHPDSVSSLELMPGGYGAAYGRALGGVVRIKQRGPDEGVHGSASADLLDASLATRAALGERWWVSIAARRAHLDDVVPRSEVSEILPLPRYGDGQVRLVYTASESERVEVGGLLSLDDTTRSIGSADPTTARSTRSELDFGRVHARYEKRSGAGVTTVLPFVGVDRSRFEARYGETSASLETTSRVFGMRVSWVGNVLENVRAKVGLDAMFTATEASRVGSIGAPAREGDVRHFGQRLPEQVNADTWKPLTGSLAPYGELDVAVGPLHVVPGARLEPYLTSTTRKLPRVGEVPAIGRTSQETAIDPRLAVRFAATPRVTLTAAYGLYHQSPAPEDLSAVFGTPTLGLSRAHQWVLGTAFKLPLVDVEVTDFYVASADLARRSASAFPPLAQALDQGGSGRAVGMQLLVRRRRIGPLFGWLSYTLSKSERAEGGGFRRFDLDQTHVLTAVAGYALGKGFDLGARVRYATGAPRTPVVGSVLDDKTGAYVPVFGELNADRLPAFFSLDVRASKRWTLGRTEAEVYLEVLNVTNHRNVEELAYGTTYQRTGSIKGLPILPVAGVRLGW